MNPRLRKHLLALLNVAGGLSLPQRLITEDAPDVWLAGEVEAELRRMAADELVVSGRNALGELNWKLTADGQAACAELKL